MGSIMDIEVVDAAYVATAEAWLVVFDVIYPGETWCRSEVWLQPDAVRPVAEGGGDPGGPGSPPLISLARDHLLGHLEAEGAPVSLVVDVTSSGSSVRDRARPGPRPSPFAG
ncbi:MAG: hypothetical protein GXX83_06940 [Gaiellales bacterium]|nr:hypothetical protein [Gaiellales bacterium]